MTNLHAQHSKGWAGLSFVALVIVSIAISGIPPAANADASTISAYFSAHRQGVLIASWLTLPISAFFLWFTVGLSAFLRRTSAVDDGLPTYVLGLGIFALSIAWAGAALMTTMALAPAGVGIAFAWGLASYVNGPFLCMAVAIFIFGVAHSMRRHGSAPAWMPWLGYLAALVQVAATLGAFSPTAMTADNPGVTLGALLSFALWTAVVSLHLIRAVGGREQSGAVSPA